MILIVGAGPAGLATAYHLQKMGLPYQILEKQSLGYAWQNHYDRLHLHTLKQVSALPGLPMPSDYPNFVPRAKLLAYFRQYAQQFDLHLAEGVAVQQAHYDDHGWSVQTDHGCYQADILVAATGIWSTPHCPTFENQTAFKGAIIHAKTYRNPTPFAGQKVLVAGGGNTGTELAVDLSEHGVDSSILIRDGSSFVPYPHSATAMQMLAWALRHAPRRWGETFLQQVRRDFSDIGISPPPRMLMDVYPVVGYELPEAVANGQVRLYTSGIARFTTDGVIFEDGQTAEFDSVILSTGYRPTVEFVAHELEFDERGWPLVNKHWQATRNPYLYCVGYHYPTTEGWLQSIGRRTKQAVRHIQKQLIAEAQGF